MEDRIKALEKEVAQLKNENKNLYKALQEAYSKMDKIPRYVFKSSSEQLELFNEAEAESEQGAKDETGDGSADKTKVRCYIRHKARNTTLTAPADTPIVEVRIDVEPGTCPRCGEREIQSGEKFYDTVVRTVSFSIVRTVVPTFSCPNCYSDNRKENTRTPETGDMLQGTIAHPLLLADVIYNKMALGLPLARQESLYRFGSSGLSRQWMSSLMMKTGQDLVKYLSPVLEEEVKRYPLINSDETPVKVLDLLDEDGNKKAPNSRSNAFMIVRAATAADGSPGPVLFTYSDNRRNDTMSSLFSDYHGCVQSDGLYGYDFATAVNSFTHLGCLVHSRRKAIEAKGSRKSGPAAELVKLYADIFHFEKIANEVRGSEHLDDKSFLCIRRVLMLPALNKLKKHIDDIYPKVLKKSPLCVACDYPRERWDELIKFLDYPYATSSNQKAENAIRPFCIGRKNFLFCVSVLGAKVSALFYSLVESCKSMGIDSRDYLAYVFANAGNLGPDDKEGWRNLLPGKADISSMKATRELIASAKPDSDRTEPYILRGKN